MLKSKKHFLLVIFDSILIGIILILALKIFKLNDSRVKGIQHVFKIKKDNLLLNTKESALKYFYEPKPNITEIVNKDWFDHEVKYTTNADSLNERYNYPINKTKNLFRIITLGDSITYGQNVNTQDNYSEKLEDLLNRKLKCADIDKFEVINLGVSGYDIEYEVERYLKRGLKYTPDVVIWLVDNWNFYRANEITIPKINELADKGLSDDYDPKSKTYPAFNKALYLLRDQLTTEIILKRSEASLERLKGLLPQDVIKIEMKKIENIYSKILNEILGINDSDNLVFDYFYKESGYITGDGLHPSEKGHIEIADNLYNYLLKGRLSGCSEK